MLVKKNLEDSAGTVFGVVIKEAFRKGLYEVRWISSYYGEHGEQDEFGSWHTLEEARDLLPLSSQT